MKIFDQLWNKADDPEVFFKIISENRNILLNKKIFFFNKEDENRDDDEEKNLFGRINSLFLKEKVLKLTISTGKKESFYFLSLPIIGYSIEKRIDLKGERFLDVRHLSLPFKNDQLQIYEKDLY